VHQQGVTRKAEAENSEAKHSAIKLGKEPACTTIMMYSSVGHADKRAKSESCTHDIWMSGKQCEALLVSRALQQSMTTTISINEQA